MFTQSKIIMNDNIVYFMINLLVLFAISEKYIIINNNDDLDALKVATKEAIDRLLSVLKV